MSNSPAFANRIHPLVAGAAVSVILVSLVGAAAITGILPTSNSTTAPAAQSQLTPNTSSGPLAANGSNGMTMAPTANTGVTMAPVANQNTTQHTPRKITHHTSPAPQVATASNAGVCGNCGTVESVQQRTVAAEKGSGVGAVAGAVIGGVLGNQVGGGNGRKLATVAGAIGGGVAGNAIEKQAQGTTRYEVRVRMNDGSLRTFTPSANPGVQNGDQVKIVDGRITLRG